MASISCQHSYKTVSYTHLAVLLAVTLGPGVDAQIRRAGVGDIAAGVASDALGSALAEQAADAAEAELRQWAAKEGKYLTCLLYTSRCV